MVALGTERAAEVLSQLTDEQAGRLTWVVAHTEQLSHDQREDVLRDFYGALTSRDYLSSGGPETAQRLLESAFGEERAAEIQTQLGSIGRPKPFKFLERVSINVLSEFLAAEHPQMVALVLVHLSDELASELLTLLPDDLQVETLIRIVGLNAPSPEAVELTEMIIEKRLAGSLDDVSSTTPLGTDQLIEVLRYVDLATQRVILEGIIDLDPELGAALRARMLTFDDLAVLDDRSLQLVLREIDQSDLTLALRAADEPVREVIFANMSTRAAAMAREDMEAVGPVRLTVIHEAQNRIVMVIRRLQDSEEIVISRPGDDQMVG